MPRVNSLFSVRCYEVSPTIPPSLGSSANCAAWGFGAHRGEFRPGSLRSRPLHKGACFIALCPKAIPSCRVHGEKTGVGRENSLRTGKNTGNLLSSGTKITVRSFYTVLIPRDLLMGRPCNEQGILRRNQGIRFPDTVGTVTQTVDPDPPNQEGREMNLRVFFFFLRDLVIITTRLDWRFLCGNSPVNRIGRRA